MPISFSPVTNAMTTSPPSSPLGGKKSSSKRELPPLFWYMESGEWDQAVERVRHHPRELKLWATLRTKSSSLEDGGGAGGSGSGRSTTKRLALHHACFKLRSAGAVPPPAPLTPFAAAAASARGGGGVAAPSVEDPYVAICRFILLLVRLYPEAASQRETRHGCLPLHLASFATCAPRTNGSGWSEGVIVGGGGGSTSTAHTSDVSPSPTFSTTSSTLSSNFEHHQHPPPTPKKSGSGGIFPSSRGGSSAADPVALPSKPGLLQRRAASDSTTNTMDTAQTNLSAIHAEETYTGGMGDKKSRSSQTNKRVNVSVAGFSSSHIHPKREEMAVQVINALLDAYPKAIRVDSEGGRLPLHTACAGRATPRVVSTLVTAYPAAARHRNKDGFLPLHLAAHWGVSHPNVAVILLKAYPDATVGRNRWERTPLEEALCMAGENGRPHQAALVRALRKHPNYWIHSPDVFAVPGGSGGGGAGGAGGNRRGGGARHPVDIDESLPSNDTSTEDDERRYMQFGHEFLIDPEEIVEREQEAAATRAPHLPPPYLSPAGLLSRLVSGSYSSLAAAGSGGGSPGKKNAKTLAEEAELALAFSLETLIQNRRWQTVLTRLASNPLEAEKELLVQTRGGFMSQRGFTPLHYACERQPPVDVISHLLEAHPGAAVKRCLPGGCLPLHIACTWYGSADAVSELLSADPSTAMATDELGNLALHSACFSGAEDQVIVALLKANPTSVLTRNNQGSRPIDICKRLRHENRRSVMAILNLKKEEILAGHRRSQSSGTWSEEAAAAAALNDLRIDGSDRGYRNGDDLQEMHSAMGVEVSYNDDENQEELLWI